MTRFARAKGSKASNERVPESTTSWIVMKQDLQKSQEEAKNQKHREKFHEERQKKYDEFVKETESKTEKKWAEFPKPNLRSIRKKKILLKITEKDVTDDMIKEMCHPDPEVDGQLSNITKKIEHVLVKERAKKNKNKINKSTDNDAPEEATTKVSPKRINIKKAKNKKPILKIAFVKAEEEEPMETEGKKQTPNKSMNQKNDINLGKQNQGENKSGKKFDKNKKFDKSNKFDKNGKFGNNNKFDKSNKFDKNTKFNKNAKQKQPKVRDNLEHKRRKPLNQEKSIKVNGEEQAIVMYLGYPVLKSDHDRLVELRKSLISKSIPRTEVQKTMQLERRKAEKILSRVKKVVCYQCRESGHMLSECPQLGDKNSLVDNSGTGLCFKCGSAEHTYKECKVSKEFSFAKCFICREQGHISSACPDNPKGLYPKGGACRLCGDVTHLKKDCPKYVEEQKSNSVFLSTISDGNIESIDEEVKSPKKSTPNKKKIVKF